jgi:hypothetical protein
MKLYEKKKEMHSENSKTVPLGTRLVKCKKIKTKKFKKKQFKNIFSICFVQKEQ